MHRSYRQTFIIADAYTVCMFSRIVNVCHLTEEATLLLSLLYFLSIDIIEGIPHDTGLLQYVMHMLATEDIEGLPPGGGINAK